MNMRKRIVTTFAVAAIGTALGAAIVSRLQRGHRASLSRPRGRQELMVTL